MGLLDQPLDEFTRFALPQILAAFPCWERFGAVQQSDDGSGGYVDFVVSCSNPNVEWGLFLSTAGDELTVGFDTDHRHFTDYDDPCSAEVIALGLEYAKEYLEERRVAVCWGDGARWCGFSSEAAPGGGCIGQWSMTATRYRYRSWTGKYDREVTIESREA